MSFFPISRPNRRSPFSNDPFFNMDHHDPFSNFHHQNTISTPHFPNFSQFPDFPNFPQFPDFPHFPLHHNIPRPPLLFGGGARADWEEKEAAYVLRVEIPAGLKKDEVHLKVEEGKVVKISGERKVEREERHENWQHMERSSGKFMRTFSLPENCKSDHVTSSFENGVLKVTVPKKDVKNIHSHVKNIQIN